MAATANGMTPSSNVRRPVVSWPDPDHEGHEGAYVGDRPHEVGHVGDVRRQAVDVVKEEADGDADQGTEPDHAPLARFEAEVETAGAWRGRVPAVGAVPAIGGTQA